MFILFQEAIDWLSSHSFVLPGGVGIVGESTGGSLSLLLATYFPDKVFVKRFHEQNELLQSVLFQVGIDYLTPYQHTRANLILHSVYAQEQKESTHTHAQWPWDHIHVTANLKSFRE